MRGWRGGSIAEPRESRVKAEKISSDRETCLWDSNDVLERAVIVASSPGGSDRRYNVVFTRFCKF